MTQESGPPEESGKALPAAPGLPQQGVRSPVLPREKLVAAEGGWRRRQARLAFPEGQGARAVCPSRGTLSHAAALTGRGHEKRGCCCAS